MYLLALLALPSCKEDPKPGSPDDSGADTAPVVLEPEPEVVIAAVDGDRAWADLDWVAQPRTPGSDHWQEVQDLCKATLEEAGFSVDLWDYGTGVDVIGTKEGTTTPSEQVLVTAHYDHIADCPGADDNASGLAAALETARVLGPMDHERTLIVACWDQEESGLYGSRAYARDAADRGDDIRAVFNFEMVGYYSEEPDSQELPAGFDLLFPELAAQLEAEGNQGTFLAAVGDSPNTDEQLATLTTWAEATGLYLVAVPLPQAIATSSVAGDMRRSDHSPFWDAGFGAIMLTDTAEFRNTSYHCRDGDDAIENLDPTFFTRNIQTAAAAAVATLNPNR